jgi:hypothetical protein
MINRYTKATLAVAVLFMLTVKTEPALAQGTRECSAKTCSEQERNCANINCGAPPRCDEFCRTEFERCMKTGEFFGRFCQFHNLIKK